MKRVAFMFPGQGSQEPGMGKAFYDHFPDIREMFEKADEVLKKDLQEIMFSGPKELLTETENAQPALLLSSMAAYALLEKADIHPVMAVGHSLGEYSALVAAGAINLYDALPLVAKRGKLMEEAYPKGQGAMAAVLGLTEEEIAATLDEVTEEIVDMANLNCPGQIVISGSQKGVEKAGKLLKEKGAKRVLPLNVSGPFHSRLMKRASREFESYLQKVHIKDAQIPVFANVTAKPVQDHTEIKHLLIEQLYSPVRFEASIRNMIQKGIDAMVEVGNKKVLSGLVRKIDRNVRVFSVQDPDSLHDFITWYKGE